MWGEFCIVEVGLAGRLICFWMVKGPTNLGASFLQGRHNRMSRVDSQIFCPGWYEGASDLQRSAVILRLRRAR